MTFEMPEPEVSVAEPSHTEGGDEHAGEHATAESGGAAHAENTSEGRVLDVDLESWPIAVAFAALSAGLAFAVVRSRRPLWVAFAGLVAGVAVVFDIAEIVHQANDSHGSLVVIAAAVATLHVAAVALAVLIVRSEAHGPADEPVAPVGVG